MTTAEELPQPTSVRGPRTRHHPDNYEPDAVDSDDHNNDETFSGWVSRSHFQPTVKFTVESNLKAGEGMQTHKAVDPVSLSSNRPFHSPLSQLPSSEERVSEPIPVEQTLEFADVEHLPESVEDNDGGHLPDSVKEKQSDTTCGRKHTY